MATQAATRYRQVQIQTASPGQRVVMMYDAIVRSLQGALQAFEAPNPEQCELVHTQIRMAENGIEQLQLALDLSNGGAIAAELNRLYDFWMRHLSDGNAHKNAVNVREVLDMVMSLRDAWAQATAEARKTGIE